jgi:membrane protein YqaA with SNARE-associated domain
LEIYLSLFASSLLAATLIPAQSEAVLVGSVLLIPDEAIGLVVVASVGNVLGALINWVLGRFFSDSVGRRLFSDESRFKRVSRWYGRYGWVTLFGSWVPVIGDPITFCAGVMREPLWRFLLVVTFAKTVRYVVVATTTLQALAS